MKVKKIVSKILTGAFLISAMCSGSIYANRLANINEKGLHCRPLPAEKCQKSIEGWFKRGCITEEERNYGTAQRPMIIPVCIDMDMDGTNYMFHSWCYCSCFAKGTRLLVEDSLELKQSWIPVEKIVEEVDRFRLIVPSSDSTLSDMKYETVAIKEWTSGKESNPLLVVSGKDGKELVLTGNHQVLVKNGRLAEASTLKVGDFLVNLDGSSTEIISIQEKFEEEDVYNFLSAGNHTLSHMVFAEFRIVGDLLFENSPEEEVESVHFPQ